MRKALLLVGSCVGLAILIQTAPDAQVYLGEVFRGQASPQGRLVIDNPKPGDHALRVSLVGKRNHKQKVTAIAGQVTKVAEAPAALAGTVVLQTSPGAVVFLEDSSRGTTDARGQLAIPEVAAGSHELPKAAPGKKEYWENITVPAGQEASIDAPLADLGPTPGAVKVNPKDGLKYVWIPPGTFMMGCSPGDTECFDAEKPLHQVMITKGFWMGQTEVTVAAYRRFVGSTGTQMPAAPNFNAGWNNQDMPIVNVTWDEATAFCGWAGGRLPTEAEWEYAARAGSTEARYGSLDEVAWHSANSGGRTHEVAQKRANGFGLYDTLGNVWEWVNDWYDDDYYQNSSSQDPSGPASGQFRVLRGGSWLDSPRGLRVSDHGRYYPLDRVASNGLRCAGS
jgi:formylglycine-generating enzyme required for sulfatase activity